jgi:hypothetical protein
MRAFAYPADVVARFGPINRLVLNDVDRSYRGTRSSGFATTWLHRRPRR